jgi:hypothetical protein
LIDQELLVIFGEPNRYLINRYLHPLRSDEIVVKPRFGARGIGIKFFRNSENANRGKEKAVDYILRLAKAEGGLLVEERILSLGEGDSNLRVFITSSRAGQQLSGADLMIDRNRDVYDIELNGNRAGGMETITDPDELTTKAQQCAVRAFVAVREFAVRLCT